MAIKAQALADFIVEFTIPSEDSLPNEAERWTIQTDGSSTQKRGRVGVSLSPQMRKCLNMEFG